MQECGLLNENNRGRKAQRGKGDGGGAERKGAGEAMRRKSTAHWGEIEMMEGSQGQMDGDSVTEEDKRSGTKSWRFSGFLAHCAHTFFVLH